MGHNKKSSSKNIKKKYHDHFVQGNANDLFDDLENSLKTLRMPQGPLVKVQATYDYEYIIKNILLKKKVVFSVKDNEYWIELENGQKFNVSEMLTNMNPDSLYINENYNAAYVDYLKNTAEKKPMKDPDYASYGEDTWATEDYFNKRDEHNELKELSYGEKCAINIYTQDYYQTMNEVLRGNIYINPESALFQEQMREVMLHNGFAMSGLKKIKNVDVKNAFRVDRNPPEELVAAKVNSVDNDEEIFTERGFLSSSNDSPIEIAGNENPLFKGNQREGMLFSVIGNIYGKNVSAISSLSKEREILLPPNTQVKYRKHKTEDGATYLYGQVVRTPGFKSDKKPGVPHQLSEEDLKLEEKLGKSKAKSEEVNPEEVDALISKVKNLKKDYQKQKFKFHTDSARKQQISVLMQKANQLSDDNNLTPKEKMVQITEVLLKVQAEIHAKQAKQSSFVKLFQSKSRLDNTIDESLKILSEDTKKTYNKHQSQQNLFDYENPLFSDRMKPIVNHVHTTYLMRPYRDQMLDSGGENEYHNVEANQFIQRPNHATAHSIRGAMIVPAVVEYFKKHGDPKKYKNIDIKEIERMQVAMLFTSVGRQAEVNNNYIKYRKDSAIAFRDYCKENCQDLFTEKQLKEYTEYVNWYTDPCKTKDHPKADLMRICHSLDLLRCKTEEEYNVYCRAELERVLGKGPAEALVSYARQTLIATGNRVQVGEEQGKGKAYNPALFTESSLNAEKALEHLRKVPPPKDLSRLKFKTPKV